MQAARKQDRRLSAALLAAALAHTPEAEEVLRGARTRMARKPSALARELLRNFPKGRRRRGGRRRRRPGGGPNEAGGNGRAPEATETVAEEAPGSDGADGADGRGEDDESPAADEPAVA